MTKVSATDRAAAVAALREMLTPGDTIYTVLRHVTRSGMSRSIDCYVMRDGVPVWLSRRVAIATGLSWDSKREAVKVSGCGMDMGYHVVYGLGATLWPHGTPESHGMRNGEPDTDGGYALKHRWM